MPNPETTWRRDGNWKARYFKLYSSKFTPLPKKEERHRISFMSNDTAPYASLLIKLRASQRDTSIQSDQSPPHYLTSLMSQSQRMFYGTKEGSQQSENLGANETLLLEMVRSRSREAEDELRDQPLMLSCHDASDDQNLNETCVHGMSIRMTERSASRSRVSRMSTRRDMDIPSILAFTASVPEPAQKHLEIPAFQKVEQRREEIPRWSIRRSVCPVCSQKWKDKTSITNIKYSGYGIYPTCNYRAKKKFITGVAFCYSASSFADINLNRTVSMITAGTESFTCSLRHGVEPTDTYSRTRNRYLHKYNIP